MVRLILPAAALVALFPASARASDEDNHSLMTAYRAKTKVVRPCDRSGDAIVVCGSQAERNARARLPLPREANDGGMPVRGDAPRASAAAVRQGSCGVTGGQGTGCVGGLSVFKLADIVGKSVMAIIDPDADIAPPPPLPDRSGGDRQR